MATNDSNDNNNSNSNSNNNNNNTKTKTTKMETTIETPGWLKLDEVKIRTKGEV